MAVMALALAFIGAKRRSRELYAQAPSLRTSRRMRPVRGHAPAFLLEAREEPHPGLGAERSSAARPEGSPNPPFWPPFLHGDTLALAFPEAWTVPVPLVLPDCPLHLSVLS